MPNKKQPKRAGPEPERLIIGQNWEAAAAKIVKAGRPPKRTKTSPKK
jgi:hypothetical protein